MAMGSICFENRGSVQNAAACLVAAL